MWIKTSGQLGESTHHVATSVSSHILIAGKQIALVDTSISGASKLLFDELSIVLGDERVLDVVLLTHAHFDHIGCLPHLRKAYPNLVVVGSLKTVSLFEDKDYLQRMYDRNAACAAAMGTEVGMEFAAWADALTIDQIVGDSDIVDLGDEVEVNVISCPGHSPDLLAYYVSEDSVLAAAEAIGGYNGRDNSVCCFRSNYEDYLSGIDKLASLEVRVLGLPHNGVLTGNLAQKFVIDARRVAEVFYEQIKERLAQGELIDEIVLSILPEWQTGLICPEGPFTVEQEATLHDMVSAVARL